MTGTGGCQSHAYLRWAHQRVWRCVPGIVVHRASGDSGQQHCPPPGRRGQPQATQTQGV